jgi:hypothetical protein
MVRMPCPYGGAPLPAYAEADTERLANLVPVITQALEAVGYRVPSHDLEDRTPRRRRRAA